MKYLFMPLDNDNTPFTAKLVETLDDVVASAVMCNTKGKGWHVMKRHSNGTYKLMSVTESERMHKKVDSEERRLGVNSK